MGSLAVKSGDAERAFWHRLYVQQMPLDNCLAVAVTCVSEPGQQVSSM